MKRYRVRTANVALAAMLSYSVGMKFLTALIIFIWALYEIHIND